MSFTNWWRNLRVKILFMVGFTVAIWVFILVLTWWGRLEAADGLPDNCPDLYDPAVVASYRLVRQVPYGDGRLRSTILQSAGYFLRGGENGQEAPLAFLIGYLTDTTNGRIIAIVQTFLHVDASDRRSLRGWMDRGFMANGKARGEWDSLAGGMITAPVTKEEVARLLRPILDRLTILQTERR